MILREDLDEILDGVEAMLLEPREVFDSCVIGIAERVNLRVVAYDTNKVILKLMQAHCMDEDEAVEWFETNIAGSWVGEGSPVFIDLFDDE